MTPTHSEMIDSEIIDLVLSGLSFQHVLGVTSNDGGYFVDSLVHLLHIISHHLEWGVLFFLIFTGYSEQIPRSPSEEESGGGLRCLLDSKWDVEKQEIPIAPILFYHSSEHPLQGLVEALK